MVYGIAFFSRVVFATGARFGARSSGATLRHGGWALNTEHIRFRGLVVYDVNYSHTLVFRF